MARGTPTSKTPKTPVEAEILADPGALPDPALVDPEKTVIPAEAEVIVPGAKPADTLTPENTPAAEPAVVLPAAMVAAQSAVPMQADASPALTDTAEAETYARSSMPAVEAAVGTMLPDAVIDEDAPRLVVTCNVEGGRRRAGRRWPQGDTIIPEVLLSPYDLAQLQSDPRFSVRPLIG